MVPPSTWREPERPIHPAPSTLSSWPYRWRRRVNVFLLSGALPAIPCARQSCSGGEQSPSARGSNRSSGSASRQFLPFFAGKGILYPGKAHILSCGVHSFPYGTRQANAGIVSPTAKAAGRKRHAEQFFRAVGRVKRRKRHVPGNKVKNRLAF